MLCIEQHSAVLWILNIGNYVEQVETHVNVFPPDCPQRRSPAQLHEAADGAANKIHKLLAQAWSCMDNG